MRSRSIGLLLVLGTALYACGSDADATPDDSPSNTQGGSGGTAGTAGGGSGSAGSNAGSGGSSAGSGGSSAGSGGTNAGTGGSDAGSGGSDAGSGGSDAGSGGSEAGSAGTGGAGAGGSGPVVPECTVAQTLCDETCVDLSSDKNNCSACGNVCGAGCEQGACVGVSSLVGGLGHTCVRFTTGGARCWGFNDRGQLGYGNTNNIGDNELPSSVGRLDAGGSVLDMATGGYHTCALLASGDVRCWGQNDVGQQGIADTMSMSHARTAVQHALIQLGGSASHITAGEFHNCVLMTTGAVRCWGKNDAGQLGYGHKNNIGDDEYPESAGTVEIGDQQVLRLVGGGAHTCALLSGGTVRCWGDNATGQLGYGHTNNIGDDETPASAGDVDVGGVVKQIAAGQTHTCALLETGAVRCWGDNSVGQLGYGHKNNIGDDETPASAGDVDVGGVVKQIATGRFHTCALLETGSVRCWGTNSAGQLGYGVAGDIGDDEPPASAGDVSIGGKVAQIGVGFLHTCAVLTDDSLKCWGFNSFGGLGYGTNAPVGLFNTPASVGSVSYY